MPGPSSKKEANANALAAFHHVVAKGQIERVKDFVLVRAPAPLGCAGVQARQDRKAMRLHARAQACGRLQQPACPDACWAPAHCPACARWAGALSAPRL